MMGGRPHIISRLAVALALLAFLLAGGAHRFAMAPAPVDPQLAAFLAMGGTLDDLCLDGEHGKPGAHPGCPACILTKAFLAAPPPIVLAERLEAQVARIAFVTVERVSSHTPRAPPGRGPPAFHMI